MQKMSTDLFEHSTPLAMMFTSRNSTSAAPPRNSCTTSTPIMSTGPPRAQPASPRSSTTNSRRRRYTKKSAAVGAKEKPNQSTRPQTLTASTLPNSTELTGRQIIRIPLDCDQVKRLAPVLDANRNATKLEGVLCTLSRAYSPAAGFSVLELQILRVDRKTANQVLKLVRG